MSNVEVAPPYVFGGCAIGPLHVQMSLPCQDACTFELLKDGTGIIAVSDGLGSAQKSDRGARLAVDAVVSTAKAMLATDGRARPSLAEILRATVVNARESLANEAAHQQCSIRDLACTIIAVIFQDRKVAIAHLGDGAVVGGVGEHVELLSGPGISEYTNEVVPLTTEQWESQLRLVAVEQPVQFLAVFTDGCQRAAFRKSDRGLEPFVGFFRPIFSYAQGVTDLAEATREVEALLASRKLCDNSEDDKTLVIACC
jgi:hypothetical protein